VGGDISFAPATGLVLFAQRCANLAANAVGPGRKEVLRGLPGKVAFLPVPSRLKKA
jgi:hypothetical protein